jgi:hypothetical protein
MQKQMRWTMAAIATALLSSTPAAAATLQQCAVNFAVCYGTCASTHPEQDVSGRGLCQAGCVTSRAGCESTASDRSSAAPPGDDKPKRGIPPTGILEDGRGLTTQSPSGSGRPGTGTKAPSLTPGPPAGRMQ